MSVVVGEHATHKASTFSHSQPNATIHPGRQGRRHSETICTVLTGISDPETAPCSVG